jgi:hypothetical protein
MLPLQENKRKIIIKKNFLSREKNSTSRARSFKNLSREFTVKFSAQA